MWRIIFCHKCSAGSGVRGVVFLEVLSVAVPSGFVLQALAQKQRFGGKSSKVKLRFWLMRMRPDSAQTFQTCGVVQFWFGDVWWRSTSLCH